MVRNQTTKKRREHFAHWLASKDNPMFSKVMANRLWKESWRSHDGTRRRLERPNGDQNPKLFHALGEIFIDVNFDFKAFLSIVFNSESYQLAVDEKNEIKTENYYFQGALLKRMTAQQMSDSLLTLTHGDLDPHSKLSHDYFAFEDERNQLIHDYLEELSPFVQYRKDEVENIHDIKTDILEVMNKYIEKSKSSKLITTSIQTGT